MRSLISKSPIVLCLLISIWSCEQKPVSYSDLSKTPPQRIEQLKAKIVNLVNSEVDLTSGENVIEDGDTGLRYKYQCKNSVLMTFDDVNRQIELIRTKHCRSEDWGKESGKKWKKKPTEITTHDVSSKIPYDAINGMTAKTVRARNVIGQRTGKFFVEFGCPLEPGSKERTRCINRHKSWGGSDDIGITIGKFETGERLVGLMTELSSLWQES